MRERKNRISRRTFLKGATLTAAGLTVFANALAGIRNPPQNRKLGVALLGLGRYATGELGPALRETRHCYLAGVVTGHPEKGEKWAADYNLKKENIYSYDTFDRIADNKDIDIVYVVTPPAIHPEFVIRAAKAGKHVISEKPMATSIEDCDRMIAACREAKVKLGIGYRLHYDPYHLEMVRLSNAKELGPVSKMNGKFAFVLGQREFRIDKKLGGGGPMMDLGIYLIHGACMATASNPISVSAKELPKLKPELFNEVEETMQWTMDFPNGAKFEGISSFNQGGNQFHIDGKKGWIDFKDAFSYRGLVCDTSRGALHYPAMRQQSAQIDDFANCVMTGRASQVPGELGRRDIKILMAIYESAATGKSVKLSWA